MLTPVGAATTAVGALVGLLTTSVAKIVSTEKELRPMIQRSGIMAESLQVLTKAAERLGSEDGLEGVTDSSQELQIRWRMLSRDRIPWLASSMTWAYQQKI